MEEASALVAANCMKEVCQVHSKTSVLIVLGAYTPGIVANQRTHSKFNPMAMQTKMGQCATKYQPVICAADGGFNSSAATR